MQKRAPKRISDMRQALDDKDVNAVVFATPEHWHALATVWASQAGKDEFQGSDKIVVVLGADQRVDARGPGLAFVGRDLVMFRGQSSGQWLRTVAMHQRRNCLPDSFKAVSCFRLVSKASIAREKSTASMLRGADLGVEKIPQPQLGRRPYFCLQALADVLSCGCSCHRPELSRRTAPCLRIGANSEPSERIPILARLMRVAGRSFSPWIRLFPFQEMARPHNVFWNRRKYFLSSDAHVAELADALDSGSSE